MFYTIYKITNKINGKIYIGKHQTTDLNDDYFGSGKHLKRSIEKYGIENFQKEILFQFNNESDMNAKEAELVTEDFCKREDTYNLCPGGKGGWGYINYSGLQIISGSALESKRIKNSKQMLEKHSDPHKRSYMTSFLRKGNPGGFSPFSGKRHTEETKQKISQKNSMNQSGGNNSQYGTMWITDGSKNRKIKKEEIIPEGWIKGRVIKNQTPM